MPPKSIVDDRSIAVISLNLEPEPPSVDGDDGELIRLAKEDLAHFQPLYEKWMPPVYRYFYHRVCNPQEAEELTGQVFLAVCEQLPGYRHQGHFAAWLFAIARRRAADFYRKRQPLAPLDVFNLADPSPDPQEQAAQADEIDGLRELIRALPEKEQELIRLRFAAGLTYSEMAPLLKRNEDAIRKRLSRLLARLQNQMDGKDE